MAEYYFERDDKLNRKPYGLFLETVLEQCDNYRREDGGGAYIIAIDSAWGTGKSYYLSMLKNHLERRTPQSDPEALPSPDAHYFVVPYNAWAHDFWGDALEPLMYTILQSQAFEQKNAEESTNAAIEQVKRLGMEVFKGAATSLLKNVVGQPATELIVGAIQAANMTSKDPFEAFKEKQQNYIEFQTALSEVLTIYGKKLVVFVDELDRCKPTFAIQTMELAKHLFNANGVIFVFALDIEQLSHSAKQVYGTGMDASGYLCRFFDYIGKMPNVDFDILTREYLMQLPYYKRHENDYEYVNSFVAFIVRVVTALSLSLRDLSTIMQTYRMMQNTFLDAYERADAQQLYFFLIALKYKDMPLFNEVFSKSRQAITAETKNYYIELCKAVFVNRYRYVERLLTTDKMENLSLGISNSKDDPADSVKINSADTGALNYFMGNQNTRVFHTEMVPHISWGNLLFSNDLPKWEQIKHITPAQYIFQQLEMFNFALPPSDDEPAHG